MYLALLDKESKELFASLAYCLAMSDSDFDEKERLLINSYEIEMGIKIDFDKLNDDMDDVIDKITEICNMKEKKIIVFELVGLAMVDSNYDNGERTIITKVISKWNLDENFGDFCENKLTSYFNLQNELNRQILQ